MNSIILNIKKSIYNNDVHVVVFGTFKIQNCICGHDRGTAYLYASPFTAAAAIKSLQSCPTLCDPIDGSP